MIVKELAAQDDVVVTITLSCGTKFGDLDDAGRASEMRLLSTSCSGK